MIVIRIHPLGRKLGRCAEAHAQSRRERARAQALLLAAAVKQGAGSAPFAHPQRANAFRPVDLVAETATRSGPSASRSVRMPGPHRKHERAASCAIRASRRSAE